MKRKIYNERQECWVFMQIVIKLILVKSKKNPNILFIQKFCLSTHSGSDHNGSDIKPNNIKIII